MNDTAPRGYRIATDERSVDLEHRRLAALAAWRDPRTTATLTAAGIGPAWQCLEVGAGNGSISRWMVDQVGPEGRVLSTDIDLRFHCDPVPGMEVSEVDVMSDPLPQATFDLVHARALFMHLPDRAAALDRLVATLRPGGWVVIEDSDWRAFEAQPLPEPLATVAAVMHDGLRRRTGWDPNIGSSLLRMFADRGLVELDVTGETRTMHGGTYTCDWWTLGIEQAAGRLVDAGSVTEEQVAGALETVHSPDFVMMSPLSLSVRGRVPARP